MATDFPLRITTDDGITSVTGTADFTDPDNQPAPSGPGGGPDAPYTPASAGATVVIAQTSALSPVLDYNETTNKVDVGVGLIGHQITATSGFVAGDNSNFGNKNLAGVKNLTATGTVALGTDGTSLTGFYGTSPIARPVVPLTTPLPQDIIDALVALGLVSQSD